MLKILFLGTSDFAIPSLRALLNDKRFEIVGIVTQPDKPVGRHAILTAPPIKILAQEKNIPVFQPNKISELRLSESNFETLASACDAFAIVSYGKILPQWLLDIPKHGVINVHGSLLPRWRGASPIQSAIASGDKTSGVTIMKIDAEMDHGPIIALKEEPISETDTGGSLHDRLAAHGGEILPDVLADYIAGKIEPREQDHELATYCKTLSRDDGKIDWTKTSEEIERLIRAYDPWPGTWTEADGKRLKILSAKIIPPSTVDAIHELPAGRLVIKDKHLFAICGSNTALEIITIQPEGKKPMKGADFISGRSSILS